MLTVFYALSSGKNAIMVLERLSNYNAIKYICQLKFIVSSLVNIFSLYFLSQHILVNPNQGDTLIKPTLIVSINRPIPGDSPDFVEYYFPLRWKGKQI